VTPAEWIAALTTSALAEAQKLHKKLKQLLNAGHCDAADVNDASVAIEALRRICDRHGLPRIDIDSRKGRKP
jgi:hypothetical protein